MKKSQSVVAPRSTVTIDPARIRARDVMRTDLLVLHTDDPIRFAAEQFEEVRASGAPVVDAAGRLLGVLTLSDIARSEHVDDDGVATRLTAETGRETGVDGEGVDEEVYATQVQFDRIGGRARIADWMSPGISTVEPGDTLAAVCRRMIDEGVHRVFVSENEQLCGVISSTDVVRLLAAPAAATRATRPHR